MFWTLYLVYPCISSYFLYHVHIFKNSYHFTTCLINWPYVWLPICMVHHSWGRDSAHQVYSTCFPMFLSFGARITALWVERKGITGRNKTVKSNISFFPFLSELLSHISDGAIGQLQEHGASITLSPWARRSKAHRQLMLDT